MIRSCILLLCGLNLFGQTAGMSARQLYLQDDSSAAQNQNKGSKTKKTSVPVVSADTQATGSTTSGHAQPGPHDGAIVRVALHLGLRYNILLYQDTADKNPREVDPETTFRTGDCIAVRFHPNRSGHIYVFNQGSSGAWQTMFPSPLMPTESNLVAAGVDRKLPEDYCFRIGGPPGTDLLLVVLTEKEEDMLKLNNAIRRSVTSNEAEHSTPGPGTQEIGQVLASIASNDSVGGGPDQGKALGDLTSRDLSIGKLGEPQSPDEPPNSVYAVQTAATKNDRMVVQIRLRHE